VHRVSLALRHLEQPGVGVRFLGPGDLVSELIHGGRSRGAGGSPRAETESEGAQPEPAPAAPPAPPAAVADAATETSHDAVEELFGPDPRRATAPPPGKPAAVPLATRPPRTVPVEFVDRASFLAVFHRDIAAGGLFVTSDSPAALHEVVLVELRVPAPGSHPLQFEARVVHRFDGATGGAKSGLTGMGVQFLDPDRVRTALAAIIDDLRP
jgi:Tfp pilus assembly protein PilZ